MEVPLMIATRDSRPLANHELDLLSQLLQFASGESALNVEFVDGFCAALIAGPVTGAPERYFQELLQQRCIAADSREAKEARLLFSRHWHSLESLLQQGTPIGPLLCDESDSREIGARWARGFLQGMELHFREWAPLLHDEMQNAALFPIVKLAGKRSHPVREWALRIDKDVPRPALLTDMSLALLHIYRFFGAARQWQSNGYSTVLH